MSQRKILLIEGFLGIAGVVARGKNCLRLDSGDWSENGRDYFRRSFSLQDFDRPLDIREGWGMVLADLLEDTVARQSIIQASRAVSAASSRPPARVVYRKLVASASRGRKPAEMAYDKVVKADDGTTLFRVRYQQNAIALLLPLQGGIGDVPGYYRSGGFWNFAEIEF